MVTIACAVDNNYALSLSVMLHSLVTQLDSNTEIHIYILQTDLTERNKARISRSFNSVANVKGLIHWCDVDPCDMRRLPLLRWMSRAAYLKLLIGEALPDELEKVLVLDSDIVVETNIIDLWRQDFKGSDLLAVQDYGCPYVSSSFGVLNYDRHKLTGADPYFNSGVMLVDLKAWRKRETGRRALAYLQRNAGQLRCHDQEGLNVALAGCWHALHPAWNQMPHIYWYDAWPPSPFKEDMGRLITELVRQPRIIHFAARNKPWHSDCTHPLRHRFLSALRRSGWFTTCEWLQWSAQLRIRRVPFLWTLASSANGCKDNARTGAPAFQMEESPEASVGRSAFFDASIRAYASGHALVRSLRSGVTHVLPIQEAQLLRSCDRFLSLDEHAANFARRSETSSEKGRSQSRSQLPNTLSGFDGNAAGNVAGTSTRNGVLPTNRLLAGYARDGLLVYQGEIRRELETGFSRYSVDSSRGATIDLVAITTRDRPALLRRCLDSYMQNTREFGRKPAFLVVDDSRELASTLANKSILSALSAQYGFRVSYLGRAERQLLLKDINRLSGCPPEILDFAINGRPFRYGTYGASRNCVLLAAAGSCHIQVDDDTVCRIMSSPIMKSRVVLSSEPDPHEYWYYRDRATCVAAQYSLKEDFIGLHERFLGRPLGQVVQNTEWEIDWEYITPELVRAATMNDAAVSVTILGAAGDSGMHNPFGRLIEKGPSKARLVEDQTTYPDFLRTREILRVCPQTAISNGDFLMTMHIGLDTRTPLQPFMPVNRREDGVFSAIMRTCYPHLFKGFLPYAIAHLPEPRPFTQGPARCEPMRSNDLLIMLIYEFPSLNVSSRKNSRMSALGRFLIDAGSIAVADLQELVRSSATRQMLQWLAKVELRVFEDDLAPKYWISDVRRFIASYRHALTLKETFIPADLSGTSEERLAEFGRLTVKFGELLLNWQEIMDLAGRRNPSMPFLNKVGSVHRDSRLLKEVMTRRDSVRK